MRPSKPDRYAMVRTKMAPATIRRGFTSKFVSEGGSSAWLRSRGVISEVGGEGRNGASGRSKRTAIAESPAYTVMDANLVYLGRKRTRKHHSPIHTGPPSTTVCDVAPTNKTSICANKMTGKGTTSNIWIYHHKIGTHSGNFGTGRRRRGR